MPELNKFKVITMVFILLFVFVVAAIYTNTKDVAMEKMNPNGDVVESNEYNHDYENSGSVATADIRDLTGRVLKLESKVAKISDKGSERDSKLNCSIQGVMSGDILVPLSDSEALKDARENGKDLVMLCSFK